MDIQAWWSEGEFVELSGHHQREIAVPVGRRLGDAGSSQCHEPPA